MKKRLRLKKEVKVVIFAYILVAIFTYAMINRVESLSSVEDIKNENRTIVLKLK